MNPYDSYVGTIMNYLIERNIRKSLVSTYRVCYRKLGCYLSEQGLDYSFDVAMAWISKNSATWPRHQISSRRRCVQHLEDVATKGSFSLETKCVWTPYRLLTKENKEAVNEFINNGLETSDQRYAHDVMEQCSTFLLFSQNNGIKRIDDLTYDVILKFQAEPRDINNRTKNILESYCRRFLRYFARKGRCSIGFSLAMNKQIVKQIVRCENNIALNLPKGQAMSWDVVEEFIAKARERGYLKTVVNQHRHQLSLVYIFLEMYHVGLSEESLWKWYELAKPRLGRGFKQVKRTLKQFWFYVVNGIISTKVLPAPNDVRMIDHLPLWSRQILESYLDLLRREGFKESTITMQRSSNIRFCSYIGKLGLKSFAELTPAVIRDFTKQDKHSTAEGKAAYNCRIRQFLFYLEEMKITTMPNLYDVLMSIPTRKVRIVKVLSEDDVAKINAVDVDLLKGKQLRDYAILMIGLTMGFRSIDIVNLRFEDIDWKNKSITLTQSKTGKLITLPMPVKTGNVLFRYLRDERPKCDNHYLFICHKTPFSKLNRVVCARALKRFLPDSSNVKNGFHVVRRTFATGLLRGNAAVTLIADSLGHATEEHVQKYLSLDAERMKYCPLSLHEVGISNMGGLFND